MATQTKTKINDVLQPSGAPYGNSIVLPFHFETTAAGKWLDSDIPGTAIPNPQTLLFGVLPKGMLLTDCLAMVSTVFTALVVLKLGFQYVDGVDVTAYPQDDDYFYAALALSATSRTRANNLAVAPVLLTKDAYLVGVSSGAVHAARGIVDFVIHGTLVGVP